jgi:hypothetical protein
LHQLPSLGDLHSAKQVTGGVGKRPAKPQNALELLSGVDNKARTGFRSRNLPRLNSQIVQSFFACGYPGTHRDLGGRNLSQQRSPMIAGQSCGYSRRLPYENTPIAILHRKYKPEFSCLVLNRFSLEKSR